MASLEKRRAALAKADAATVDALLELVDVERQIKEATALINLALADDQTPALEAADLKVQLVSAEASLRKLVEARKSALQSRCDTAAVDERLAAQQEDEQRSAE